MTAFNRERLACAYFFAVPGLAYGIFTSRLPAIKAMVQATDGEIGILLLVFGAASFTGLLSSRLALQRWGLRTLIRATAILLSIFMSLLGLAGNYAMLLLMAFFGGVCSGLCEVAMNAQGMLIEQKYKKLCMASLHASFSLGGLTGSLSGALFAFLELSPGINFIVISGCYILLSPIAFRSLENSAPESQRKSATAKRRSPAFIYLCGLMSMLCYVSEGSVGEWGSILLHSVKGAPQDQAALVFGCFCLTMVIFRFTGDRLRYAFGDLILVCGGGALGAICMAVILLSPSPLVCLIAYSVMGMGFAPIVPILFSRAGKYPDVSPSVASSTMSILSYTGLLVFPPFLGFLGDSIGLDRALWLIAAACLIVCAGGFFLLRGPRDERS
ncbi:MAG: MFS transporter [Desulfovibrio sp.]|nr:MFS transporter [Desulfovibrio sp.]